MSRSPRTSFRSEHGAVMIIFAGAMIVLLGFAGLVVDIGNARQNSGNLQTASDAGSLAGAQQLATSASSAEAYAADYAFDSANQARGALSTSGCAGGATACASSSAGSVVSITTPYTGNPNLIHVQMCQTIQTTFARVLGINTTQPCKSATALYTTTGNCVICVMDSNPSDTCTFQVGGNAGLAVTAVPPGPITVNSPNSQGVCGGGSTDVESPGGFTWFGCASTCTPKGTWNPSPVHGPQVPDPLANVPVPSVGGPVKTCADGATCNPGVYSTISAEHSTTTLNPGVYVVTGSINMKENGTLLNSSSGGDGSGGVMIYLACSNYPTPCNSAGEVGAGFSGNGGNVGTAAQPLSAPTSGTYSGLLIFADRNNTADLMGSNGNITYNTTGTIYGLNATITLGGNAGATLDSRIVIGQLHLQGTPSINETYSDQYQGLPTLPGVQLVG